MKRLLKNILFWFASSVRLPNNRASILMYHSIRDTPDYFGSVSPRSFEAHMAYLAQKKVPVISLAELTRRLEVGASLGGSVVITFDDGYRDNFTHAYPILKKYGFHATIFMVTDLIGKSDTRGFRHLSFEELKEMEASGLVSIEAHTKSHPKLATLAAVFAREEVEGSKCILEELLRKRVTQFAYPYGNCSDETVRIVKDAGFGSAVGVIEGTIGQGADLFRLKRNSIDRSTTFTEFKGKISRAVDIYESLKII